MQNGKRDRWRGRFVFIMAAVGSAVGLGNVWRFPYVAFENGGGAFLIPYFVALITAGIPLMILEYALGQKFQSGPPRAMGQINKGFKWVGWMALLVGLSISFYYVIIMAYCWFFTFASPGMEWTKPVSEKYIVVTQEKDMTHEDMLARKAELEKIEAPKPEAERKIVVTQDENAQVYFNERVLGGFHPDEWRKASAEKYDEIMKIEGVAKTKALADWQAARQKKNKEAFSFVPHLVFFSFLTWLVIFLIIFKGVKNVGKVVMFTVPAPIILMGILIIQGLSLEGAGQGINFFLTPNWEILSEPKVWLAAYSQIFFSLSLGFGILIAYASYQPRESDVSNNAFMTSFCNCATSFYASFAVFSVVGYLATAMNKPVGDVINAGPGLVFVTYPLALAKMGDIGRVVGIFFFLSLLMLGIDSAFSIVEGVITGIHDYTKKMKREVLVLIVCLVGFIFSLPYCLKSGLMWLDIVDNWMGNYGLAFVGLMECVVVGYFFTTQELKDYVNEHSEIKLGGWWDAFIKFLTPAVLIYLLASVFIKNIVSPYGDYHDIFAHSINIAGWGYFAFLLLLAFGLGRNWFGMVAIISLLVFTLILRVTGLTLAASTMGALGVVLLVGGFLACLSLTFKKKRGA